MVHANDPRLKSFIAVDARSHFPIQNLPFGIFSSPANPAKRAGVAIGEWILDLQVLEKAGLLRIRPEPVFGNTTLNEFLSLGCACWHDARQRISELLREGNAELRDDAALRAKAFHAMSSAALHMPVAVGGFSDFMLSKEHSSNCVSILGGEAGQLWPNWHHLPIGYNSRASSVIPSGTPVRRPNGQTRRGDGEPPRFGPSRQVDFELETALVIGKGNALGEPISMAQAEEHAFGVMMLNDWSARDIQQWEVQPLGVFNSKNFATSVSPWIVTLEALEPFRVAGPKQEPSPLPYLQQQGDRNFDIHVEAAIWPKGAQKASTVCRSSLKTMYWSFAQQVVHQTSAGCNVQPGDLMGTGTVSSGEPGSLGCLFEITRGGKLRFDLEQGGDRLYLEDGDQVTLAGWCEGDGYRVGLGVCEGRILPALDSHRQP